METGIVTCSPLFSPAAAPLVAGLLCAFDALLMYQCHVLWTRSVDETRTFVAIASAVILFWASAAFLGALSTLAPSGF